MKYLAASIFFLVKAFKRTLMYVFKSRFKSAGKKVIFDPFDRFSYKTISLGDDVFIGSGANFSAQISSIDIGNKVMFGPDVSIRGGDHNTSKIGEYMYDIKEKLPENDLPVIIENDVWIGTRVTILKGVRIGTGSILAAGALVTKDVLPYSIVGGVPAKLLKMRFEQETLKEHIDLLRKKEL